MTEIPVRERVIRVITNTLKEIPSGTKITSESSLRDDLGADSLDIVDITMTLEEEFGIEIPDEDVAIVNKGVGEDTENFTTVGGIVSYIERRTSGRRTN
ncbi:MAG: acyl carrier protein [Patescibacteria group bacterium]|nr:acyl carrier protein [Patescibacteria group bacterium]